MWAALAETFELPQLPRSFEMAPRMGSRNGNCYGYNTRASTPFSFMPFQVAQRSIREFSRGRKMFVFHLAHPSGFLGWWCLLNKFSTIITCC